MQKTFEFTRPHFGHWWLVGGKSNTYLCHAAIVQFAPDAICAARLKITVSAECVENYHRIRLYKIRNRCGIYADGRFRILTTPILRVLRTALGNIDEFWFRIQYADPGSQYWLPGNIPESIIT